MPAVQPSGAIYFNDKAKKDAPPPVEPKPKKQQYRQIQSHVMMPDPNRKNQVIDQPVRMDRAIPPKEEARTEVEKNLKIAEYEAPGKVDFLVKGSNQILMHFKVANPLDLWPDEITIDSTQINLIFKQFLSQQVKSILIQDISDISVETSILFATLIIIDKYYKDIPVTMKYLSKNDAIRARRIIQGLRASLNLGIDYTQFSPEELSAKMEEIGKVQEAEE